MENTIGFIIGLVQPSKKSQHRFLITKYIIRVSGSIPVSKCYAKAIKIGEGILKVKLEYVKFSINNKTNKCIKELGITRDFINSQSDIPIDEDNTNKTSLTRETGACTFHLTIYS